jgi:tetratricopeptide (TPR) repeat protein
MTLALIFAAGTAYCENEPQPNPKREHAIDLYRQGKLIEAMPLLEELSVENPKDVGVMESWGASVFGYSQTLSDTDSRKKARIRARSILIKARELGDKSDLLETLLRDIPEDGSFSTFSDKKEVNDSMQAAEADFARGDLEKARQGYMRAFLLDGTQYYAALFIGDTYYRQHQLAPAGQWFAQAIKVDPDKETAYRYWGDALLGDQKFEEARSKYIEAIIADPYNSTSWNGLKNWLGRTKLTANWLKLKDGVSVGNKDGKTNITMDSSLPGKLSAAWLAYGMNHALWINEKFKKEFPKETTYRHSLKEETEGLEMFLEVAGRADDKGSPDKSDEQARLMVQQLQKIEQAGFLEPFALLNRADNGVAQDYPNYRQNHRETIRRYFDEFVLPKTPTLERGASQ